MPPLFQVIRVYLIRIMPSENKFVIVREDLVQDPLTVIGDSLLIGRLLDCELILNHPAVSRVQAGIKVAGGNYYLFALRPSNPVKLNGRAVEVNEALAAGDILEVGPFILEIDEGESALFIKVSLQIARQPEIVDSSSPDLGTAKLLPLVSPAEGKKAPAKSRAAPLPGDKALDIFWDKRIREAGKMVKPSPLFPKNQRRAGKTQFNWRPTSDLLSRWPISYFSWGAVVIGLLSIAAAYWYPPLIGTRALIHQAQFLTHTRKRNLICFRLSLRARTGTRARVATR